MSRKIVTAIITLATIILIALLIAYPIKRNTPNYSIITTNFIGYDIARAITGDDSGIKMLIKPGSDIHSYEPTPQDIIDIKSADLFIYTGGESDEWVEELLSSNDINESHTLKLMDFAALKAEDIQPGMTTTEEDPEPADGSVEYDEHIWTTPANTIQIISGIKDKLIELFPDQADIYTANADAYIEEFYQIDQDLRDITEAASRKTLIFGDRFPFLYFVDEYGLDYYAAFPGCAEQTEASSATVAFLIDKAKTEGAKIIFKIELSDGKLASTIAEEAGAEVMELHSGHNISQTDLDSGVTYADIMRTNTKTLQKALE